MLSSARVRLLEVDPDLGALLMAEELAEARQLAVPVLTVERDEDLEHLFQPDAFGALVLEGVVLRELQVADQRGMRLLGPGDILPLTEPMRPMLVVDASFRTLPGTRLALLGRELMFAARRWPALLAGLQQRAAQQTERLATQLVICQLPRVDQRLLALLWLIAESWGRVTPAGTVVPLRLTHEALGALIGARRPTVTLALRELAERGAIVRQNAGWLLLEDPPTPSGRAESIPIPSLLENGENQWGQRSSPDVAGATTTAQSFEVLKETLATLRARHDRDRNQFNVRLGVLAKTRERCRQTRVKIARDRVTRRRLPSS
jgi:CRP-like cAMP-binding protein